MKLRSAILAALVVASLQLRLCAQGVDHIKAHYAKREDMVHMRDGSRLFTASYSPRDTSQRYPFILVRTQSGCRPYGSDAYPETLIGPSPLPHFVKEGYIFVVQDVRGRWMSEGEFVNMRPHNPDKRAP